MKNSAFSSASPIDTRSDFSRPLAASRSLHSARKSARRCEREAASGVYWKRTMIEPRTLKGFRDYLPELMIPREWMLEQARRVYRSYGFAPIDTPALEYAEILLGKGGEESDKQLYRFQHHNHDIALRFDLTVPFARFAAMHIA